MQVERQEFETKSRPTSSEGITYTNGHESLNQYILILFLCIFKFITVGFIPTPIIDTIKDHRTHWSNHLNIINKERETTANREGEETLIVQG